MQVLRKIASEADVIAELLDGVDFDFFRDDEKTKRAVSMTLINIGELVKSLSEEIRLATKHIPWRSIAGLRDVTAHRYQTLRPEDIWETVQKDVPMLRTQIAEIIK